MAHVIVSFMYYHLLHIPKTDIPGLKDFKGRYDKHDTIPEPHITLVFPFKDNSVTKEDLINHIEKVLHKWRPFSVRVKGIDKSWDHWMFLLLQQGNEDIIKLHDDLYTDILKKHLRRDIEFIPHIGLGVFVKNDDYDLKNPQVTTFDEETYAAALMELSRLDIDFTTEVDSLTLIEVDNAFKHHKIIREFIIRD